MLEVSGCLGSEKEISEGGIGEMYIFGQVYGVNEKKKKSMGHVNKKRKNIIV